MPPFPRVLQVWVGASLLLQGLNVFRAASCLFLVGVFSVALNGVTFFLLLLLFGSTSVGDPPA